MYASVISRFDFSGAVVRAAAALKIFGAGPRPGHVQSDQDAVDKSLRVQSGEVSLPTSGFGLRRHVAAFKARTCPRIPNFWLASITAGRDRLLAPPNVANFTTTDKSIGLRRSMGMRLITEIP